MISRLEPLRGAAFDVGDGRWVPPHPDDDRSVESGVGLAVAAAVESVAVRLAGSGRDWARAAERGEVLLVQNPVPPPVGLWTDSLLRNRENGNPKRGSPTIDHSVARWAEECPVELALGPGEVTRTATRMALATPIHLRGRSTHLASQFSG